MTAKDLTTQAKNSPAVAFHRFVLMQKEKSQDLFCFYEGADNGYYYPRIKEFYNGNHHPIKCGNKKSVLGVYKMIKSKYPEIKTSFFIDNDYDKRIENNDIYETPCYSIENLYTSEAFVSDVLKNEFGLLEIDQEFTISMELFKENQIKYHEKSLLFNAWYASAKDKSSNQNCSANICLNCSIPKNFVLIKIGNISGNYNLSSINEKFPDAIKVTEPEVLKKFNELKSSNLSKVLRGKYELEFMHDFFQYLIEDANNSNKRTIMKKKTKFRVDKAQMLSQLSQYAETPDCLRDYIKAFN